MFDFNTKKMMDIMSFYTAVSRRAVLCDWVWRAGVHTGFCTITLVLYIGSLPNLATWFPCGRGRTLFILGSLALTLFALASASGFDSHSWTTFQPSWEEYARWQNKWIPSVIFSFAAVMLSSPMLSRFSWVSASFSLLRTLCLNWSSFPHFLN